MSFFTNLTHRPRVTTVEDAEDADMSDAHQVTGQISSASQLEEPLNFLRPTRRNTPRREGRNATSARLNNMAIPSHSEPTRVLAKINQAHPFFKALNSVVQFEILSYLPSTDISSLRKLCQEFYDVVAVCEPKLAARSLNFHRARLQDIVDSINATQPPTDASSLLACLRVWTSIRGSFSQPKSSVLLLEKWFSHLEGGTPKARANKPLADFQRWAHLATKATCLQEKVNYSRRHGWPGGKPWKDFERSVLSTGMPILDAAELWKLYDRIISTRDPAEHDIKGPFHHGKGQKKFLPRGVIHHRLSPIRPYAGNGKNTHGQLKITPPTLIPETLSYLYLSELPKLPDGDTFCYYLKHGGNEEWVGRLLKARVQSGIKKKMSLLMQATVLEFVEIF